MPAFPVSCVSPNKLLKEFAMFLLNLLLALAWLLLTGQFTLGNFLFGFVVTYLVLWAVQQALGPPAADTQRARYFRKPRALVAFGLFFLKELVAANLRVAAAVLQPHTQLMPAVVTVPLRDLRDGEVTLLANLITLTPGTLSIDVVEADGERQNGERVLRVHAMHAGRTNEAIARFQEQLSSQFVTRVREVMR
jgi:multicomponent Na+:H+ antiporter subunit E